MRYTHQRYFIQEHLQETVQDGGIGYVDGERILVREGFQPIHFPRHHDFSFTAKLVRLLFLLRCWWGLPRHSIIVFQYPLYAGMNKLLLSALRLRPSIRVICLLADINGLKQGDAGLLRREVHLFRRYHYFIVHNEAMRSWLLRQVPDAQTEITGFFDFLASPVQAPGRLSGEIAFAGNLYKSLFLEQLPQVVKAQPDLRFRVYGPHATAAMQNGPGIRYEGVFPPYEMPRLLQGSFGLVWDGDGIEGADGSMGQYMEFISHHKLSLYLVSGMPVLVYARAGSAALVQQYGLGIGISSLLEIGEKIGALTEADYQAMCRNVQEAGRKIAAGDCLREALTKLLARMQRVKA
ncbi:MAG: hypothetical protein P0Y53_18445 [Candidatus Pseudobacter hemicellulosilyticus]|uniref:Beta-1,6-galactofuranosyltransferase n=1 Tax=Candidatus Pseudobacter hemicellulosilyticus TaxID=3121375 RepID=A0AAJ5WPE0_9BACT|nr:MAG: hypothetical protein P0Y53_18445 [Pseudobacter sp.]